MSTSMLDGKVGRIYMPRQEFDGLALRKMKARTSGGPRFACSTLLRGQVLSQPT